LERSAPPDAIDILFVTAKPNQSRIGWPLVIVGLGLGLTVIWIATLFWLFITASAFAATSLVGLS